MWRCWPSRRSPSAPSAPIIADPHAACRAEEPPRRQGPSRPPPAIRPSSRRPRRRPSWSWRPIVGTAGLPATLAAVRRGAMVAFANKECLVSAGPVMMAEIAPPARRRCCPSIPSTNAIFQVFDQSAHDAIERLILTASGGAVSAACAWPRWRMSRRRRPVAHPKLVDGRQDLRRFPPP